MAKQKFEPTNPVDNPANDPMKDYETQGHLETIVKAHQILMDPDKMKKVHKLAGRHEKAIKSIGDLKDLVQKKYGPQPKTAKQQSSDNDDDGDMGE